MYQKTDTMEITVYSVLQGKYNTMEIPMSNEEFYQGCKRIRRGELIQNVFPQLSIEQREFLITGTIPKNRHQ
jgi:hypothetical protein